MSITEATNDLRKENPSNKRDMETEEIQKLNRGLENLPQKELYVVAKIIKKRGVPQKQNNEKLQLDINNIEVIKTGGSMSVVGCCGLRTKVRSCRP
uniref:NET domain-containing protein n=1 Tax=Solanum lycopersicum TaxID=4081 RepID=A0A3Q7FVN0_SOLLC